MSQHSLQSLLQICAQLHQAGKTPNTALVRAKAPRGTPLPAVVSAVQQWKSHGADVVIEAPVTPTTLEVTLEQRVTTLEAQVAELLKEIEVLKASR